MAPRRKKKAKARVRKKPRFEPLRYVNDDKDPIIESLRNISQKCTRSIGDELLEQVALEGLTGITFGRLCLILDATIPALNSCQDDAAQDHIWEIIIKYTQRVPGARVQIFYLNPDLPDNASPTLNKKNFYIDKSIKLPDQTLKWLAKTDWVLSPVQDETIMGSCPCYTSRVNISEEVAALLDSDGPRDSLQAIHEKYDLKNVFLVADQELRRRAILPMTYDPNMDIKLREYACLELIGRTRSYGIVFPNDKTLGRYRILLSAKGLISQFQQTCNTFIIHHIRRFTQYSIGMTIAKAFKGGSGGSGGKCERSKNYLKTHSQDEDGDNDEDDDDDVIRGGNSAIGKSLPIKDTCCHPRRLKSDRDMLKMVYDVIACSRGRSMCDIRRKLKIPKHHARNHLKNLANIELIGSHTRIVLDKKTRIYRARHRSSRRKILNQKKYLKGVRSRWDTVDVRARDMLGNRRSQFSQAEDSLLILCRIAGLLLQPNLTKLSFVIPKQAIRDILHDELYESHDKTSDSLLRRTKFLRKMPSNVMLINELTAELRDDTDIVRLIGIKKEMPEESRSTEKTVKLFKQVLRAIRAKLPHLLGLTSSLITAGGASGSSSGGGGGGGRGTRSASLSGGGAVVGGLAAGRPLEFSSIDDLKSQFELIDCQVDSINSQTSSYHQPTSTLVQLAESLPRDYRLEISKCSGMRTIMLLASCCTASAFDLDLRLKVPVRVVGLDQDSENFKEMFEHAKESKETSRLIANLTTPNPTADSRRALFMLRNALKLQTIDKCGKLADALVVQPCDITFSSGGSGGSGSGGSEGAWNTPPLDQAALVRKFLAKSRFTNEFAQTTTAVDDNRHAENDSKSASSSSRKRRRLTASSSSVREDQQDQQHAGTSTSSGSGNVATRLSQVAVAGPLQRAPEGAPAGGSKELDALLDMIESVLSWISHMPGIELKVLQGKLKPRLAKRNNEHLSELLELMLDLELISRDCQRVGEQVANSSPARLCHREPRLFGYQEVASDEDDAAYSDICAPIITLEPRENAYVRYCQLLELDLKE